MIVASRYARDLEVAFGLCLPEGLRMRFWACPCVLLGVTRFSDPVRPGELILR